MNSKNLLLKHILQLKLFIIADMTNGNHSIFEFALTHLSVKNENQDLQNQMPTNQLYPRPPITHRKVDNDGHRALVQPPTDSGRNNTKKTASSTPRIQSWTDNRKKSKKKRKTSRVRKVKSRIKISSPGITFLIDTWAKVGRTRAAYSSYGKKFWIWVGEDDRAKTGGRCQVSSKWLTSSWSFFFCFAHFVALGLKAAKEQLCWEKKIMWI